MAAQQLSAKRDILAEQLSVASAHLELLVTKRKAVDGHSKQQCNFVSTKFAWLKNSLDRKEKELISMVLSDTSRVKEELNVAITSAELMIEKSAQVCILLGLVNAKVFNTGDRSRYIRICIYIYLYTIFTILLRDKGTLPN